MKEFTKLVRIMAKLRHPRRGCPWDLAQSPQTLKEYILEEAHELLEAIDNGRDGEIKEELGDLLLQIVFLARMSEEKNQFSVRDVITAITEKLVRRHPHIFAQVQVSGAAEVKANWEQIKIAEKNKASVISDYPPTMPSLLLANRIAAQASGVGFDWNDAEKAFSKIDEETEELRAEIRAGQTDKIANEIGDLLFAVANVARLLKINPEFALAGTNKKFTSRFRYIESELKKRGRDIRDTTLAELDDLWNQAKSK
jgi:tetrapyrrole methylase family protein/MazG family protein